MSLQQPTKPNGAQPPRSAEGPVCPKCQLAMTIKQITPVLFASNIDDVVYGCERCGNELKRSVKRP